MKVIAKRGNNNYLVAPDNVQPNDLKVEGVVVDVEQQKAFPPKSVQVILKWGWWTEPGTIPVEHRQIIDRLIRGVAL